MMHDVHPVFATKPDLDVDDGRGSLRVWYPAAHVAVTRIEGHLSVGLADTFMAAVGRAVPHGLFAVHDWSEMTGFDSLVPPRLVGWTLGLRPRPRRVVIATAAPLVTMAVRAANLTMKTVELVEKPDALGPILDDAISAKPAPR